MYDAIDNDFQKVKSEWENKKIRTNCPLCNDDLKLYVAWWLWIVKQDRIILSYGKIMKETDKKCHKIFETFNIENKVKKEIKTQLGKDCQIKIELLSKSDR